MSGDDEKLLQTMNEHARNYNWDVNRDKPVDNEKLESTKFWDQYQYTNICCGIDGIETWDKVRPANIPPKMYPPSCCSDYNPSKLALCPNSSKLRLNGCMAGIDVIQDTVIISELVSLVIGLVLSLTAFILSREL